MTHLSPGGTPVPPSFAAGLVLVAFSLLDSAAIGHPSAVEVIDALGASRSRAYAAKARLEAELPGLVRGPGRPSAPEEPAADTSAITAEVLDFVMRHPGCVHRGEARTRYSDRFRHFLLALCERERDRPLDELAAAAQVPISTLGGWLAGGLDEVGLEEAQNLAEVTDPVTEPRIAAVLNAWTSWSGDFVPFCTHVQRDLRVPFGRALIDSILHAEGVRIPRRRPGWHPDVEATRGSFETFFANAQWVGDGKQVTVEVAGEVFTVNLELMVDAATGAFTGASVRDEEDAVAVVEAFHDGVATTEEAPIAVLLDNKPSNHANAVVEGLGDTMKIRATAYRPENKAHVEGSFGLFSQVTPALRIESLDPQRVARDVVTLVVTTWARVMNHRPRADRGGKSRVQLQQDKPTEAQRQAAKEALAERVRKQDEARETRRARLDPVVRELLDEAFVRLGLSDPERHLRDAIARYPVDAIVNGVAVFEGKQKAGTLPPGVDVRYLLGIVRRVADEQEGRAIAEALFDRRVELRDKALRHLQDCRDAIEDEAPDALFWLRQLIDQALAAERSLDRYFWLRTAADLIEEQDEEDHRRLFLVAARRVHAAHAVPKRERNALTRRLATMVRPVT